MNIAMSHHEMEKFLAESHLARIATIKPHGTPHVTPVWYLWQNNQLLISIVMNSVKAGNIRQNNKVAVTIDTPTNFGKGVIIEGTANIEEIPEELLKQICQRYVKEEDLEKYLEYAHTHYSSILLRINPEKIMTWDYLKDPFWTTINS